MNLSPVSGPSYLAQSLIYDRPLVVEDKRAVSEASVFPPSSAVATHASVTKKLEEIAGNPNLTDKQKRAMMNDLRKQLGLSKGDMKKLYMKPLEKKAELEGDEEKRKLYASMYKPGGCVKKVFKGIGKGLATVGKVALGVASVMVNPASLIPMAASLVSKIPGVSKVTGFVENGLNKVTGWVDKGVGYVEKGVETYKNWTRF